jgi:hypothetical protein
MKFKVLVVSLLAFFAISASALAFTYHLPFYKAENGSREIAQESCAREAQCVSSGVQCRRLTEARIDCLEALLFETQYGELICENITHWGVGPGGYIVHHFGKIHCAYLE